MPTKASKIPKGFDAPTANDDLYVNQGESYDVGLYYPTDDPERVESEAKEKSIKAASYPIIPEIAAWFAEQINLSSRNSNIKTQALTINGVRYDRTVSIEGQVLAYQLLEALLTEKAAEFGNLAKELEP